MTHLCQFSGCSKVATWLLVTSCECLNYRCDACKSETQDILDTHARRDGPNGRCVRCGHPLNPTAGTWQPVVDTGPQVVDEALGLEVDAALAELVKCSGWGCQAFADWRLVMPCGHAAPFCATCKPVAAAGTARLAAAGTPYVCAQGGPAASWADFVWEAIA